MKNLQKIEAIKRLKMLKLHENVLADFKEGVLNLSENGILYWLNDEEQAMVDRFEKEYNSTVYHVIKTYTSIGTMYSLMHVSPHEDEWELDIDDLKDHYSFVYVENVDDDLLSEFGSIAFKERYGGLIRTA